MREILFRGKRTDNGAWIEGSLLTFKGYSIFNSDIYKNYFPVYGATIGQYTGLKDKNGKRIFEGDIVKTKFFGKDDGHGRNFSMYDTFQLVYFKAEFRLDNPNRSFFVMPDNKEIEVIGNVHDNPELMEG